MSPFLEVVRDARRGQLPSRYDDSQRVEFDRRARSSLVADACVLDVGAGKHPTFPVEDRPLGCRYVGLDLTASELDAAPPGSYQDVVVADAVTPVPALEECFDLVVSWQVLEHVKPLATAIENVRSYLRPGGRFLAHLSGTFSVFGMLSRLLPPRTTRFLANRVVARPRADIFPAYYDHCYDAALRRMGIGWSRFEVVPRFYGADYVAFSPTLRAVYLGYEEWTRQHRHTNLAGYYLIDATR